MLEKAMQSNMIFPDRLLPRCPGERTGRISERLQDRPDTVGSRQYTRVLALAGGLPIKVGVEIVGAVGVSGTPGKDDDCSQACAFVVRSAE